MVCWWLQGNLKISHVGSEVINPKARRSAIRIALKCFHFWMINTPYLDGTRSTMAEWHFLWSRRSTTKPPRLDNISYLYLLKNHKKDDLVLVCVTPPENFWRNIQNFYKKLVANKKKHFLKRNCMTVKFTLLRSSKTYKEQFSHSY